MTVKKVLPSVFPYLIFSGILMKTGFPTLFSGKVADRFARVFNLTGDCIPALLVGLFAGFPMGAAVTAGIYQRGGCTKGQAERLSAICNFCAPPFLLGAFGQGVMGDLRLGLLLFGVQTAAALLYGFVAGRLAGHGDGEEERLPLASAVDLEKETPLFPLIGRCVAEGALQTVRIGGYVLFFSLISGVLLETVLGVFEKTPLFKALLCGFFEFSSGIGLLSCGGKAALFLGSMIVCWSGLSVHMQVAGFLNDAGLSVKKHLKAHLLLAPAVSTVTVLLAGAFGLL